jgi:hypothetical protein
MDKKITDINRDKIFQNTLFYYKINEEILEDLKVEPDENKQEGNSKRMPKIMQNYRPSGRR